MAHEIYIPENLMFQDYIAVIQTARTWADGYDQKNSAFLLSALAPQVAVDYSNVVAAWGIKHYTADEFAALWLSEEHLGLPPLATQHLLGQPLFKSVTADEIVVKWQQLASHGRRPDGEQKGSGGGPPVVSETSDGRSYMEHRFVKQADGRWKIASITPSLLYTTGDFMRIRRPVGAE
ncbi:hypothetical protein Sste5346_009513 [Sporothrix stenoceras]|uniref:Scytalone dehydratase-like domain-containing protein n=1 Tax=Sporothrix stenoceras TaxID=5173 RepID=A0ABR3YJX3_9PEZI